MFYIVLLKVKIFVLLLKVHFFLWQLFSKENNNMWQFRCYMSVILPLPEKINYWSLIDTHTHICVCIFDYMRWLHNDLDRQLCWKITTVHILLLQVNWSELSCKLIEVTSFSISFATPLLSILLHHKCCQVICDCTTLSFVIAKFLHVNL